MLFRLSPVATVAALSQMEERLMSALSDLQAQVQANTSAEASAVQLIKGLAAQITTAVAANDGPALQALSASLNTSATALGAAITANTPAAPVVPAAPTTPTAPVTPVAPAPTTPTTPVVPSTPVTKPDHPAKPGVGSGS